MNWRRLPSKAKVKERLVSLFSVSSWVLSKTLAWGFQMRFMSRLETPLMMRSSATISWGKPKRGEASRHPLLKLLRHNLRNIMNQLLRHNLSHMHRLQSNLQLPLTLLVMLNGSMRATCIPGTCYQPQIGQTPTFSSPNIWCSSKLGTLRRLWSSSWLPSLSKLMWIGLWTCQILMKGVNILQVMRTWLEMMLVRKTWSGMIWHGWTMQPPLGVMMALMTCSVEKEEKDLKAHILWVIF